MFTSLTVFGALLKDVPMGCKNAVLAELPLKNHTTNCLTFEENTRKPYNNNLCLFPTPALHLHGNQRLEEETSEVFDLFTNRRERLRPSQFQEVHMIDIPIVEDLLLLNILLYDIDIVEGNNIAELTRRSVQKHENTLRLLKYKSHICYVSNIKQSSNHFVALIVTFSSTSNPI